MTPPIVDKLATQLAPWISILVGIAGLALLGIVFGRWFGRRDIIKRASERAEYISEESCRLRLSNEEVGEVLSHLGDRDFKSDYDVVRR